SFSSRRARRVDPLTAQQSSSVAIWQTLCCSPDTLFPKTVRKARGEGAAQHEHAHMRVSAVAGPSPPWRAHLGRFLPRLGLHGAAGAALFLCQRASRKGSWRATRSHPSHALSVFLQCKIIRLNFVRRTSKWMARPTTMSWVSCPPWAFPP